MSSKGFKQQLFDQFARIAKAMANGYRLELLEFLAQGERSVESLSEVSGLTIANTSQHLQRLRQAGLVTTRTQGHKVIYRLANQDIMQMLDVLRRIGERNLAEVDRLVDSYLHDKDKLDPVSANDLLIKIQTGEVTVLDVRPKLEFEAGHLPGAVNVPLKQLALQLDKFPPQSQVVAYCRGPYCALAFEAVKLLRKQGFQASRLEYGLPEWVLAGHPVENGSESKNNL